MKMFFFGQWDYAIEKRGRIVVPAKFRKGLGKEVILIQNGVLLVYPKKKIVLESFDPGKIWVIKIDKENRVLIPDKLRCSLVGHKITWVGKGDHFEVWLRNN